MRLLSQELRQSLPSLGSQRGMADPMVHAKFWIPDINWIWYVIEGQMSRQGYTFYGYVIGLDEEWEGFSLSELEVVRGPNGQRVHSDHNFTAEFWSKIRSRMTNSL